MEIKCGCCFLQIIVYTTSAMSPLKMLQLQVVPASPNCLVLTAWQILPAKKLTDEFGVFWIKWMPDNSIFMAWKDSVMIMKPQAGSSQWKVDYMKAPAFGMDKNQTIFHFTR